MPTIKNLLKCCFFSLTIALLATRAHAQIVLSGDPSLAQVTVASDGCQCQHATGVLNTSGTVTKAPTTLCTLSMSIPVQVEGPGRATFSYSLFGDALSKSHDGVNAWISFGPGQTNYIATRALPPAGVIAHWPGGSWIGGEETLDFHDTEAFTVYLNVAYGKGRQEWGCNAPKVPSASYLQVTVEPLP